MRGLTFAATRRVRVIGFIFILNEVQTGDEDVYGFDAYERNDDAAQAVDEQVALQNGERADGFELHSAQCQRDEGDNDERIENDGAQDGAGRAVQAHDVERRDGGERRHEHGRDDGKILRNVVGDAERRQRTARDEELLPDFDDLNELRRIRVEVHHVAGFLG